MNDRVVEKLMALGDPSGQQDGAYWNEWFSAVCYDNQQSALANLAVPFKGDANNKDTEKSDDHSSFEWYCEADQVSFVLAQYLPTDQQGTLIFHPGSGNSNVPFYLRECVFTGSRHIIMDVSDLAMKRMQLHLRNVYRNAAYEYRVGNVLQPLPFEDNTFDAWVDKGLIDALFSGKAEHLDSEQSRQMMMEAHRILKDNRQVSHSGSCVCTLEPGQSECCCATETITTMPLMEKGGGLVFIVSMAQQHSLILILENWLRTNSQTHDPLWNTHLHIHEVHPSSGTRRPFVFVLQKFNRILSHHHSFTDRPSWSISFHTINKAVEAITINQEDPPSLDHVVSCVENVLDTSQLAFQNQQTFSNCRLVFTKLEIKPCYDTVDLHLLHDFITNFSWEFKSLSWYNCLDALQTNQGSHNMLFAHVPTSRVDTLHVLKHGYIQEIGYGISKLVLACFIDSDDLDNLRDAMLLIQGQHVFPDGTHTEQVEDSCCYDDTTLPFDEHTSDDDDRIPIQNDEYNDDNTIIQSIDIDWDSTVPIGTIRDFIQT